MVSFFQNNESQGWSSFLKSVSSATAAEVLSPCSLLTSTAVLLLHENTDHITGIHKSNQREEYLDGAVDDLQVLEINDAACHRDVGVILQDARGRRTHHPPYAARPVLPPPGAVH